MNLQITFDESEAAVKQQVRLLLKKAAAGCSWLTDPWVTELLLILHKHVLSFILLCPPVAKAVCARRNIACFLSPLLWCQRTAQTFRRHSAL